MYELAPRAGTGLAGSCGVGRTVACDDLGGRSRQDGLAGGWMG